MRTHIRIALLACFCLAAVNVGAQGSSQTPDAPANKPPAEETKYELGPGAKVGSYAFNAPAGWGQQPVKDNPNAALYRSPDRATVILVVVRAKEGMPADLAQKYAQTVVQRLKQEFARNKTEVVEPPAAVPDPRFFLKIRERLKVKEKTGDQAHLYRVIGKDMIELTVMTTAEPPETVAAAQRLGEEVLLSFKAGK